MWKNSRANRRGRRTAFLNLQSSAEQVEVAQSNIDLAEQTWTSHAIASPPASPTRSKWCRPRNRRQRERHLYLQPL